MNDILHDPASTLLERQASARAIFAMLESRSASAAEIGSACNLHDRATRAVLDALTRAGHLQRNAEATPRYARADPGRVVLGADIGGTKIHLALSDLRAMPIAESVVPTDGRGGTHVVEQIRAVANDLADQNGIARNRLCSAAFGCAGVPEHSTGRILLSPNIPGLDSFDVVTQARDALGCPVLIENDVNLAALGEAWHGGSEANHFAFIALGTGIGMGLVIDGILVRGSHGVAGEIAYLPIGGDLFDPANNALGTLETAIGSVGILRGYHQRGGRACDSVAEIFDRLVLGDPIAAQTIDHTARTLVNALAAVRAIVDPESFVLGGGIGVRPELLERVQALIASLPFRMEVEASSLGIRATLLGAISLAVTQEFDRALAPVVSAS
jgi:predicted NBD/HSP70 family sugar kinase